MKETENIKALSKIAQGKTVCIVSVHAGQGLRSRLATMGLVPKIKIKVVHNGRQGPFVVSVKHSRMVLGRGVADKIMVKDPT